MDVVELRPREQQAERAEEPRERRHEHRPAAELLGEPRRVHRAGAAVGDQRELARVAALLGRDRAQRAGHARVRELVDARGRLEQRQPERPGDARDRLLGQLGRDRDLPVGDRARRHQPEHDVRVGDRRVLAAAPVAGRPGRGARAARPDLQPARGVEPGDRAAARADLGDVDRRDPQQLARAAHQPAAGRQRAADLVLAAARDRAALDQRRLRGRAAHVERDRVREAEPLRDAERRDDARGRARTRARARAAGPVSSAVITPPDDCMIVSGASIPAPSSPLRMPAM